MRVFKKLSMNEEILECHSFKSEASMQAFLIENQNVLSLDDEIYNNAEIKAAELHIEGGRKSKQTDGRADIIAKYESNYAGVFELKKGELCDEALKQLVDYLKEKNTIQKKCWTEDEGNPEGWVGVLVGTSINTTLREEIKNGKCELIDDAHIPIAAITMQRYKSEGGDIYITTDCIFNISSSTKNYDKYDFDGNSGGPLGKGKLVLAVIKKYVADHPDIKFSGLTEKFPATLHNKNGNNPTFVSAEDAQKLYEEKGYKRYFINPDQIIKLSDGLIAVNNQWGRNIGDFIKWVNINYEYKIKKYEKNN